MKRITAAAYKFVMRHDRVLALDLLVFESVCARKEQKLRTRVFRLKNPEPIKKKASNKHAFLRSDEDASIELLVELLLCKILDNLSAYIIDLAEIILSNNPNEFFDTLKIDTNGDDGLRDDPLMHRQAIESKIDQLSFFGFRKLSDFFVKSFGLSLVEPQQDFDFLVKMFELRNCTVHNDGVISETSAKRCPELRDLVGHRLDIPHDELTDHRRRIESIFFAIDKRFMDHFKLPELIHPWRLAAT